MDSEGLKKVFEKTHVHFCYPNNNDLLATGSYMYFNDMMFKVKIATEKLLTLDLNSQFSDKQLNLLMRNFSVTMCPISSVLLDDGFHRFLIHIDSYDDVQKVLAAVVYQTMLMI